MVSWCFPKWHNYWSSFFSNYWNFWKVSSVRSSHLLFCLFAKKMIYGFMYTHLLSVISYVMKLSRWDAEIGFILFQWRLYVKKTVSLSHRLGSCYAPCFLWRINLMPCTIKNFYKWSITIIHNWNFVLIVSATFFFRYDLNEL